jgi:hypothetical protein
MIFDVILVIQLKEMTMGGKNTLFLLIIALFFAVSPAAVRAQERARAELRN